MKIRIVASGEGRVTGIFEGSEEECRIVERAIDCIGEDSDEDYSPSVYIEEIDDEVE